MSGDRRAASRTPLRPVRQRAAPSRADRSPRLPAQVAARRRTPGASDRRLGPAAGGRRVEPVAVVVWLGLVQVVGLVMLLSASSVYALQAYGSAWFFFARQLLWLAAGWGAFLVARRIPVAGWRRRAPLVAALSAGALVLVLIPGLGLAVNGSTRWLGAGSVRIQPSEIAKLAVLLLTARVLADRSGQFADPRRYRPVLLAVGLALLLVMAQPDMGTAMVLVCIVAAQLTVAGVPDRRLATLAAGTAGLALAAGFASSYRRQRLLSFLHPQADPTGAGYQTIQGHVALATGGLVGVGLGASRAKYGFLPNAHTDFIFAVVGEELGLLGALVVVALFFGLALVGIRIAARAADRFGALVAVGVTAWVCSQALINIGTVIGLLPVTGVPLPFISYGGTSVVILMAACGILARIARGSPQPARTRAEPPGAHPDLGGAASRPA